MDYEIVKLKEIADFNKESIGKNSNYEFINYLDTANITNGAIDTVVRIPIEEAPSRAKRIVHNNDIVYSTVRPNLCHYGILDSPVENMIVSTGFTVISCKDDVNPYYVYNYLIQNDITSQLHSIAENSTSAYPSIKPSDLENIEIKLPKLDIQNKIAKILTDIDKKIKINNEINNNLYELAINYLKEKVEETEVRVSKFAKIQGGYAFKSKDLIDTFTKNRIIKIKNLRTEINADVINSQFVENEVIEKLDNKFRLSKGDVVIAMTGAELGKTGFIYGNDNYYLNQRVGVIRGNNKASELYLSILFLSDEFQTLLNSKGYGSAQPNVSTSDIENILINDITEDNLKELYEIIKPIYEKIISNSEEILNLEQLRDTLLPKLMNGEIDLDNIEI